MAPPAPLRGRAALLLALAAAAPARPGEPSAGFRTIGGGACRTESGGSGTFTFADPPPASATGCQQRCAEDSSCVAFEVRYSTELETTMFNPDTLASGSCEIHTETIMDVAPADAVECWVKDGHVKKRKYALLGTGKCLPASLERSGRASWDFAAPGSFDHHYQCRTACDMEGACTAYELRQTGGQKGCTLWTDPVTQVEPCEAGGDCRCWVKHPVAKPVAEPAAAGKSPGSSTPTTTRAGAASTTIAVDQGKLESSTPSTTRARAAGPTIAVDQGKPDRGKASPFLSCSSSFLLFLFAVESGCGTAL